MPNYNNKNNIQVPRGRNLKFTDDIRIFLLIFFYLQGPISHETRFTYRS